MRLFNKNDCSGEYGIATGIEKDPNLEYWGLVNWSEVLSAVILANTH